MNWSNKKSPGMTAQLKTGVPVPGSKRLVAPPVYRPSAKRVVIQPKMAEQKSLPTAPPVYRPQPTPMVLQKKSRQQLQPATSTKPGLAAGPVRSVMQRATSPSTPSALQAKFAFTAGQLHSKHTVQLAIRRHVRPPEDEEPRIPDHKEKEKGKEELDATKIRLDAGTPLYHGTRVSEDRWWERELPNRDKDGCGLIFFTVTRGNTPKQDPKYHVISYATKIPLMVLKVKGVNKAFYRKLITQHGVGALWDTRSSNGEENFVIPMGSLSTVIDVPRAVVPVSSVSSVSSSSSSVAVPPIPVIPTPPTPVLPTPVLPVPSPEASPVHPSVLEIWPAGLRRRHVSKKPNEDDF